MQLVGSRGCNKTRWRTLIEVSTWKFLGASVAKTFVEKGIAKPLASEFRAQKPLASEPWAKTLASKSPAKLPSWWFQSSGASGEAISFRASGKANSFKIQGKALKLLASELQELRSVVLQVGGHLKRQKTCPGPLRIAPPFDVLVFMTKFIICFASCMCTVKIFQMWDS